MTTETENPTGPNGCDAAVSLRGEHIWCDQRAPHLGIPHGSTAGGGLVWKGTGDAEDPAAQWRRVDPEGER